MKFVLFVGLLCSTLFAQEPLKLLQSNLISGLIPDVEDGYGVVFRDLNADDYPDVYLVCFRNLNRLLVNNGGIIPFIDRTVRSGLGGDLSSRGRTNLELGAACADFDNDGRPDLFLAGWGKTAKLFRNQGNLQFEDITARLNVQGLMDANQGLWFDANNDGFLDLYVTDEHHSNRLFFNNRRGTFVEQPWAFNFADTATSQGAIHADFDGDGDQDLYVCNWHGPDYLLQNDGRGAFNKIEANLPTLKQAISTNSAAVADVDNDGLEDLLVAGHNGKVYFYGNQSLADTLKFRSDSSYVLFNVGHPVYGLVLEDFNQDGWLDIFMSLREAPNRLYRGDGGGGFEPIYDSDNQIAYSTGCATADVDRDGDLDLFVANKDQLSQVYLNPLNHNHAIRLKLVGVRSNREAVGTKINFYSGQDSLKHLVASRSLRLQTGYLSSREPFIYLGLGTYKELDAEIRFPSGKIINKRHLKPGNSYTVYEYGIVWRLFINSWAWLVQNSRRAESWINLGLFLLLVFTVTLYVRMGLARYSWQAPEIASQLLIWFIFSFVSFMAVKGQSILIMLATINGISISALLIALVYSEHQLRQKRLRRLFRQKVQDLSDNMITLHDNRQLFESVVELLQAHTAVEQVKLLASTPEKPQVYNDIQSTTQVVIDSALRKVVSAQTTWVHPETAPLAGICSRLKTNVLIPVRRGDELFAIVALQMSAPGRALNREDLQLLVPLTNQIAITVENNRYIAESAKLVQELTEARTREKYLSALEDTNRQLDKKNQELNRLFQELQQKEGQLIHSEKMASLGHLVAGISHELNNPISFIYANTKALDNYLKELAAIWSDLKVSANVQAKFESIVSDLQGIVEDNLRGSQSVKELVLDLKNFSRLDHAEWKESRLADGIETSLKMLRPQFRDGIEVKLNLRDNPPIYCNPGQLNQVFLNLFANAAQAMHGKGRLTVSMEKQVPWLIVTVADSGPGVPENVRNKIFDPFFTTKDVNEGTGLGLSISYSIVERHRGKLELEDKPGQGAVFKIYLPLENDINLKAETGINGES